MGTNGPTSDEVRDQLKKILASKFFDSAGQPSDLLKYLIENTVAGREVKAEEIRMDVFPIYAPESSIVRVVATHLRKRLAEYYKAFPDEQLIISFPRTGTGHSYRVTCAYHDSLGALYYYNRGKYLRDKGDPKQFPSAAYEYAKAIELDSTYVPAIVASAEIAFLRVVAALFSNPSLTATRFQSIPKISRLPKRCSTLNPRSPSIQIHRVPIS
jgi:hypothetical protein